MKAIILSAGQGRRLLPLTQDTPKCALPVLGRSVLEWQLNEIARVAVDEVVVVSGFGANAVDEIAAQPHGVPVRTLYNPFYGRCDNLGTGNPFRRAIMPAGEILAQNTLVLLP